MLSRPKCRYCRRQAQGVLVGACFVSTGCHLIDPGQLLRCGPDNPQRQRSREICAYVRTVSRHWPGRDKYEHIRARSVALPAYDLIIISLSSLSWAFLLTPLGRRLSRPILGLIVLAGSLTVGPGATVSLALFAREGQLPEHYQAPIEGTGKREGSMNAWG